MSGNVIPVRLRQWREHLGLTQEDLGKAVGVARQTIAAWESGETSPTLTQLFRLARAMTVPLDALLGEPASDDAAILFRADDPAALAPELRAAVARKVADYAEVERLAGETPAVPPACPVEGYDPDQIEEIARRVRNWLGLDDGPLFDVSWLETIGIKVIFQDLPDQVSGFSAFNDAWGVAIIVNRRHPGERQIFTLLHELGHAILHRKEFNTAHEASQGRRDPREKAANHFAGAVLLPTSILVRELRAWQGRWLPEPLLLDLKRRYRASMRTILYRAAQARIISQKQMGQQIGILNRKYGEDWEPGQLPPLEEPTRLRKLVFRALADGQITTSRAAEILGVSVSAIRDEMAAWLEGPSV
nr:MAG: DNA-binding protein [Bacillota bacterium]